MSTILPVNPVPEGLTIARPPRPRPSIAVVAVHGVADQQPRESAGAIANLLLGIWRGGKSVYTSFREVPVRIPTRPVQVRETRGEPAGQPTGTFGMEERAHYLKQQHQDAPATAPAAVETEPQAEARREADYLRDHDFMRAQLEAYEPSDVPYDTVRLEGHKLADGEPVADVHVYEMYWADLSRLGSGLMRIAGEFYQLLLHLANLGRVVVDHAVLEHPGSGGWKRYRTFQASAVRVLTLFTPVLGLLSVASICTMLPGRLPDDAKPYVAAGFAALVVAVLAGVLAYRSSVRLWRPLWALFPVAMAGLGIAAVLMLTDTRRGGWLNLDQVLALEWLLLCGAGLHALYGAYQLRRPGALLWGWVFMAPSLAALVWSVARSGEWQRHALAALRVFELQFLLLSAFTGALVVLALAAGGTGWALALRLPRGSPQRVRARRAAWTARATLALSTVSIFILTLVVFGGLTVGLKPLLDDVGLTYTALIPYPNLGGSQVPAQVLQAMLKSSATTGFPVLLACVALTAVLAAWAILPGAISEITAPRDASATWRTGSLAERWKRARRDGDRSERMGRWLTDGYKVLAFAATLLWFSFFVVMPVLSLVRLAARALGVPLIELDKWQEASGDFVLLMGGVIAVAAVGMVAASGRLNFITMGFRPALDVALDVDNYLREFPRKSTPRARIAERYVSLLRYLCLWRDDEGRPYSSIVVVSHSQGTVITADLLRFLNQEPDPELAPLLATRMPDAEAEPRDPTRLYLFTMGSPLRQLYGRAFPHLYAWITSEAGRPGAPLAGGGDDDHRVGDRLPEGVSPNPADLGISRWVNAYRAGDYVGRELWRPDGCDCLHRRIPAGAPQDREPPSLVVSESEDRSRRELCIGGGAHTHYWDETAPAVGVEVDLLVEDALRHALRPA